MSVHDVSNEPSRETSTGPSSTVKVIIVWLVIGTLGFLAAHWFLAHQERSRISVTEGEVILNRGPDGHYHWPGFVNGVAVTFLVDTGATRSAVPEAVAQEAQLSFVGASESNTANGVVLAKHARAQLALQGGVRAERLLVSVLPQLDSPLLGMDVLGQLVITQSQGQMRIRAAPGREQQPAFR